MKIKLLPPENQNSVNPLLTVSHAAQKCYQAETPVWGKRINEEERLFKPSHHTTFQHASSYFTFDIEDIAISDITLGLHLASPFYNSDQRSGRYCSKMFLEPDYQLIREYVVKFWPEVEPAKVESVVDFVKFGVDIFHNNVEKATKIAIGMIKAERPFAQGVEATASKIAQEQLRAFISLIFPTGLDFTINLTALAAMRLSAWTPGMRYATNKMAELIVAQHPELAYVFSGWTQTKDWAPKFLNKSGLILLSPNFKLHSITSADKFVMPAPANMHPVDTLHFRPEYMNNSVCRIKNQVELSLATMGQDQRHRTISRSEPVFTGNFYLPPIPYACDLRNAVNDLMSKWLQLKDVLPASLWAGIAPYGAMMTYEKDGSANAVAHEQAKRLCFCAQEEIYNLGRMEREAIQAQHGTNSELLKMFEPPCYRTGICAEGARYCGRDLRIRETGDFFPKRQV